VLTSAVTPLLGELYSHKFLSAGLGLRIAGAAVFGIGTIKFCGIDANEYGCNAQNNTLLAVGAIMYGSGMLCDIAIAKGAARRYNGEHASPRAVIVPTALRGASSTGFGLAIGAASNSSRKPKLLRSARLRCNESCVFLSSVRRRSRGCRRRAC
jgi:hypothetical protein